MSKAIFLLVVAAMMWGTNPVALRYVYLSPHPPTPAFVAAIQSVAAAAFLFLLSLTSRERRADGVPRPPASSAGRVATSSLVRAGLEIGALAFVANALTVIGFSQTVAARGAFLIRLSVVFTALLAAALGEKLGREVWLGAVLACAGGLLISADHAAAGPWAFSVGDAAIIAGASLWAAQTVRLSRHAPRFPAIQLAAFMQLTMAVLSLAWLGVETHAALSSGRSLEVSWGLRRSALEWTVLLWPAIGPWGLASALQVLAQKSVSATRTQIVFATDPLWATLFAGLLGGAEQHLGWLGGMGAVAILAATILSSRSRALAHA